MAEGEDGDFRSQPGGSNNGSVLLTNGSMPTQWENLVHNHLRSELHGSEIGRAIAISGISYVESDLIGDLVDFWLHGMPRGPGC